MASYKQKCIVCRKEYALVRTYREKPICDSCKRKSLTGEIKDEKLKAMFDLPIEFYLRNNFLRDIKEKYLRFGSLSEKQVEMFKKVAEDEKAKVNK